MNQAAIVTPAGDDITQHKLPDNWSTFAAIWCTTNQMPLDQCILLARINCDAWLQLEEFNNASRRRMGVMTS
ncbi:MAG: hypothetical protein U0350_40115 [Caldilineaceae bacterium]